MKSRWKWLALLVIVAVAGCTNEDRKKEKNNFDHLYFDYTVTGDEDGPYATCMLQFKMDDIAGNAMNISPASVKLDGQTLEGDSAGLSGYYYEIQKPLDSFSGKHTLVVTAPGNRDFTESFEFNAFTLEDELPQQIHRGPLTLRLKNFPAGDHQLRVFLLDGAFESEGYNEIMPVKNGVLTIDNTVWRRMQTGPIIMQLTFEKERPLPQVTKAGGRISISYGLKREFELVD